VLCGVVGSVGDESVSERVFSIDGNLYVCRGFMDDYV